MRCGLWTKVESSISRSIKRLHRPPTETMAPLASKSHSNLFTYFDIISAFHIVKDSYIFCYIIPLINRNCPIYPNIGNVCIPAMGNFSDTYKTSVQSSDGWADDSDSLVSFWLCANLGVRGA